MKLERSKNDWAVGLLRYMKKCLPHSVVDLIAGFPFAINEEIVKFQNMRPLKNFTKVALKISGCSTLER
jgi:hypothetical protein